MDRFVVQQKEEIYKNHLLRLNPYIINKLGIIKNKTYLKLDDYILNCVPFDLGLNKCSALSILGVKEAEFFKQYTSKVHSLHLTFENPIFSKPVSLFLKVKIKDFKHHNKKAQYCFIDIQFLTVPLDFKEIYITTLEHLEQIKTLYNDETLIKKPIDMAVFKKLSGDDHATVHYKEIQGIHVKLVNMSIKQADIFGEFSQPPKENEKLDIECTGKALQFHTSGIINKVISSNQAPDYYLVTVYFDFDPAYVEALMTLLKH